MGYAFGDYSSAPIGTVRKILLDALEARSYGMPLPNSWRDGDRCFGEAGIYQERISVRLKVHIDYIAEWAFKFKKNCVYFWNFEVCRKFADIIP